MPTNTPDQQLTLPLLGDPADQQAAFAAFAADVEPRLVHFYVDDADRTARNPAPVAGELAWLTTPGRWEKYTGTAWWELAPVYVRKTAEAQVVNNSVALVSDTELFAPVRASARYLLDGLLVIDTGATADFKADWTGPAGFTMPRWTLLAPDAAAAVNRGSAAAGTVNTVAGVGIGTFLYIPVSGIVVTAATAGTLTLRWAPNALEAVNTRVKTDSWFSLTRVG